MRRFLTLMAIIPTLSAYSHGQNKIDSSKINSVPPVVESLELVGYQTGFYKQDDLLAGRVVYVPMVILKVKNISNASITDNVTIQCFFASKGKEWSVQTAYFQVEGNPELPPGIVRQITIQSDVGYEKDSSIARADVSCHITVDGQSFKDFKIDNKLLPTKHIE